MVPLWKYRRLAPRVQEVLDRLTAQAEWFAAYQASVGASAAEFADDYDKVRALESRRRTCMEARTSKTAALVVSLRGWAGLVSVSIPTEARGDFGSNPEVSDDVMSDVEQLIDVVDEHEKKTGKPLPFSAAMRTQLNTALEAAKAEWAEHGNVTASLANARTELKLVGERFHRDLVVFRAAIASFLGSSHPDYQLLRIAKVKREEDEVVEVESEAVAVASAVEGGAAE